MVSEAQTILVKWTERNRLTPGMPQKNMVQKRFVGGAPFCSPVRTTAGGSARLGTPPNHRESLEAHHYPSHHFQTIDYSCLVSAASYQCCQTYSSPLNLAACRCRTYSRTVLVYRWCARVVLLALRIRGKRIAASRERRRHKRVHCCYSSRDCLFYDTERRPRAIGGFRKPRPGPKAKEPWPVNRGEQRSLAVVGIKFSLSLPPSLGE